MKLLNISEVLRMDSLTLLEKLYSQSNDHKLDSGHITVTYEAERDSIIATLTAKALTEDFQPGRYSGSTAVKYERESIQVLFNGVPTFYMSSLWPVNFKQVQQHLRNAYGVLIELQDVHLPNATAPLSTTTVFNESDYVAKDYTIEFRISDLSPRFIAYSRGGASIKVRIVDPNGGDLELIGPTKLLFPVTSLDG